MFSEQFAEKEEREAAEVISNKWKRSTKRKKLFSEDTLSSIPLILDPGQAFRFLKVFPTRRTTFQPPPHATLPPILWPQPIHYRSKRNATPSNPKCCDQQKANRSMEQKQ